MALRKRRGLTRRSASRLSDYVRWLFETGETWTDLLAKGEPAPTETELRALWRTHGEGLTQSYRTEFPGERPLAWWRWSAPEPLGQAEDIREYLDRHGLLSAEEKMGIARRVRALGWTPDREGFAWIANYENATAPVVGA